MQPVHPNMMLLSSDCLAASNKSVLISVIGPTQDGSSSHRVMLTGWLKPDQCPFILDIGSLILQAVNPTLTHFLRMGPKACRVALELFSSVGGWELGGLPAILPAWGQVEGAAVEQGWWLSKLSDQGWAAPPPHKEIKSNWFLPNQMPCYCCLCCFCFVLVNFVKSFRVSKAGNVS